MCEVKFKIGDRVSCKHYMDQEDLNGTVIDIQAKGENDILFVELDCGAYTNNLSCMFTKVNN